MQINQRSCHNLPNSGFSDRLSTESQSQNPEFRNNQENFHPYKTDSAKCHKGVLIQYENELPEPSKQNIFKNNEGFFSM